MALDGVAAGVIAPYVETVAQAQALRGAVKLRPIKGERLAAALRDVTTLEPELRAYVDGRNQDALFIINIESTPALDRLDDHKEQAAQLALHQPSQINFNNHFILRGEKKKVEGGGGGGGGGASRTSSPPPSPPCLSFSLRCCS